MAIPPHELAKSREAVVRDLLPQEERKWSDQFPARARSGSFAEAVQESKKQKSAGNFVE